MTGRFGNALTRPLQRRDEPGREDRPGARYARQDGHEYDNDRRHHGHRAGYGNVERLEARRAGLRDEHAKQTEMHHNTGDGVDPDRGHSQRRIDTAALEESGAERKGTTGRRQSDKRGGKLHTEVRSEGQPVGHRALKRIRGTDIGQDRKPQCGGDPPQVRGPGLAPHVAGPEQLGNDRRQPERQHDDRYDRTRLDPFEILNGNLGYARYALHFPTKRFETVRLLHRGPGRARERKRLKPGECMRHALGADRPESGIDGALHAESGRGYREHLSRVSRQCAFCCAKFGGREIDDHHVAVVVDPQELAVEPVVDRLARPQRNDDLPGLVEEICLTLVWLQPVDRPHMFGFEGEQHGVAGKLADHREPGRGHPVGISLECTQAFVLDAVTDGDEGPLVAHLTESEVPVQARRKAGRPRLRARYFDEQQTFAATARPKCRNPPECRFLRHLDGFDVVSEADQNVGDIACLRSLIRDADEEVGQLCGTHPDRDRHQHRRRFRDGRQNAGSHSYEKYEASDMSPARRPPVRLHDQAGTQDGEPFRCRERRSGTVDSRAWATDPHHVVADERSHGECGDDGQGGCDDQAHQTSKALRDEERHDAGD